jgi:hypothetical protein
MAAYPLAFQPLLAEGQLARRGQHPRGEHSFGQTQIPEEPPAILDQLSHPDANCGQGVKKSKQITHRRQNVLETGARSSFHIPLPFNDDRIFFSSTGNHWRLYAGSGFRQSLWVAETPSWTEVLDFAGVVLKLMSHVRDGLGALALLVILAPP